MKYRLKESPVTGGRPGIEAGTVVHQYHGHDYGAASMDTLVMGEQFMSVSLVEGETPFFTVPVRLLEAV